MPVWGQLGQHYRGQRQAEEGRSVAMWFLTRLARRPTVAIKT